MEGNALYIIWNRMGKITAFVLPLEIIYPRKQRNIK
jgi:hypothetical protein